MFIGLKNWAELIKDKVFWNAFKNNLLVMVLSIVIQMPIGLALATFLDKVGKKGNICKVIWFIPMLMSSVAIGYLFRYALDANTGFVTAISKFFGGGTVDLLGNTGTVLVTCIFIIAWQFIPFYMVYYLAGYSGLPSDIDGGRSHREPVFLAGISASFEADDQECGCFVDCGFFKIF